MKNLISYFASRHLLANVIFGGLLFLAVFIWLSIGKEEMPEFASNWVRVNTTYPGASAEDVELFITKPMEDELKGVVGIDEVRTTSSLGISSIRITLDDNYPKKDETVKDIQDAVLRVKLPSEVRDLPKIRQFKSSEKAIIDIGIYHLNHKRLDTQSRAELQKFVYSFESQLLAKNEISSIDIQHYLKPELQIIIDPKKILEKEISLSKIQTQIQQNNIRVPIGSLVDKGESKLTALNELESVESLEKVLLQGNYEGSGIVLKEIATIQDGHQRTNSIFKVNGHEAIFMNIKKSISTDILTAHKVVKDFIKTFKATSQAPVGIVTMDDESYAVRNRLKIIGTNGIMGFILIVIVLLIFLDVKTGFWVAMGIPFCIAFTLLFSYLFGFTVNNMTLAGVIIVLGIVVDDAIIIAENISRKFEAGLKMNTAAIEGAYEVFRPILASIITTCVAFVPLMFFEGFFGKLVRFIPPIVIFMLIGSLFESIYLLPSHMAGKTYILDKFTRKSTTGGHWFNRYEQLYEKFLTKLFKKRSYVLTLALLILVGAGWAFLYKMKFVMFPREESKEVFIKVKAPKTSTRFETSKLIEPLEKMLASDKNNVVGVRSSVAVSRWGGAVKENEASILVEVYSADERDESLNSLINKWKGFGKKMKGLDSVRFLRGRWGHDSGNALEIQVQENNDVHREKIVELLQAGMKKNTDIIDIDVDRPLLKKEYLLKLKQADIIRYDVTAQNITTVLRSFVEGSILYSINKGDEEVDVRLTVPADVKDNLDEILNLRVENKTGNLIFLRNVIDIEEVKKPINIARNNFKRSTMVYANLKPDARTTPLEVAQKLEKEVFPNISKKFPTSILKFKGEVEDTRESQGEFTNSIIIVIGLIYFILILMFNSLFKPLLILSVVPFGVAGVIFILLIHGMSIFGFFAVIGALGMIGVVVNDAIVMIDKIEKTVDLSKEHPWQTLAKVAASRLRPIVLTTLTTVVGVLPTAYGIAGYDSMLAEMMLTMGWGLAFGTVITLIIIPILYSYIHKVGHR